MERPETPDLSKEGWDFYMFIISSALMTGKTVVVPDKYAKYFKYLFGRKNIISESENQLLNPELEEM